VNAENWRKTLLKTKQAAFGRVVTLLGASELNPDYWDELQESLLQADIGIRLSSKLIEEAQATSKNEGWTRGNQIREYLREELLRRLKEPTSPTGTPAPHVILLIGVNGSGKTTTAARLAYRYLTEGLTCLFAAADTYRAAATEQLEQWAEQLGVDVIGGPRGSDPGAVVYSAIEAAVARKIDVLLIDSSGRMHTQHNLMAELKKLEAVAKKVIQQAPHQILLVLDSTTGQNGLSQAKAFSEAVDVSGVVLAKLDSSSKGGIAFSIASQLDLPINYVGWGEKLEDLSVFDPPAFVDALLAADKLTV
jgi:fused signal recognition particle receptor